jgi:hypothetical protein
VRQIAALRTCCSTCASSAVGGSRLLDPVERAVQRRELTFRVEYEGTTQTVQVTAINRLGEPMVISTRKLGS